MKLIMENWRRFKSKVDENNEKLQRLYDLTDQYPNIEYERLQDISWQVHDMMHPRDPSAIPIGIKDLDLEFEGDEAEFAKRIYALNKELKRKSLKEEDSRWNQAHRLMDDPEFAKGVDKFIKKHKLTPEKLINLTSEQNIEEFEELVRTFYEMHMGTTDDTSNFDVEQFITSVTHTVNQGAQNTVKEVAKVNTRLMSRIMATRDSAARQGRWDLVDACAALLKRNKQGEYNFKAFEGQLESAFASSNPGETLNAAADAIMDSYRKLGRKSTVNESASPSMVPHAKIAGELIDAVNKFGFRKLSNNDHSQLRNLLGGLRDKSHIDARDSIIDFLVGKRLANRSLFYNIR